MARQLLIINADDLGYDPAVTRGIVQAMREGLVTSATLMVNTPFSEEAAAQARGLPIGLHLNLARYPPVSNAVPRNLLEEGVFREPRAGELPADVVREETLAQLDRLVELIGQPATHIDVHKHLHRHPNVLEGVAAAAHLRGVPARAIDEAMRATLGKAGVRTTDHFIGDAEAEPYWTADRLRQALEQLPEGVTELMCHPGYTPEAIRSGYAAQREVELRTFVDPNARQLVERLGIELASFASLR
jgi:predicted glycoside hydrolase/deacetylase ChbG (UPF0249 family)